MSKVSNQKKGGDKTEFFWWEKKTEKREFCRLLQGYKNKFSKERARKTKQCDNEWPRKRNSKRAKKGERNGKTRRDKKKDNKPTEEEEKKEIKRQRRHSKRKNVEKVFLGCEKWRDQKKEVTNWVNTIFQIKKQFFSEEEKNKKKEKTQRNISPFEKMRKWNTWETPFLFFQRKKETVKTDRIQKIMFCWKNWSM